MWLIRWMTSYWNYSNLWPNLSVLTHMNLLSRPTNLLYPRNSTTHWTSLPTGMNLIDSRNSTTYGTSWPTATKLIDPRSFSTHKSNQPTNLLHLARNLSLTNLFDQWCYLTTNLLGSLVFTNDEFTRRTYLLDLQISLLLYPTNLLEPLIF